MNRLLLVVIILSLTTPLLAQQSLSVNVNTPVTATGKFYYTDRNQAPRAIEFEDGTVPVSSFIANIDQYLKVSNQFTFAETGSNIDELGMRHHVLQQYYNGIPLEGLIYRVHEKNGFVRSANGKVIRDLVLNTQATISEDQAFYQAKMLVNSTDTTRKTGKLLIVSKGFTLAPGSFSIAYQFDITVSFVERWRISIDARTGDLINKINLVKSCFNDEHPPQPYARGSGVTKYYGRKSFPIEKMPNGTSRLIGQTSNGVLLTTYTFHNKPPIELIWRLSQGSIISSYDTTFNDVAAASVQWGIEKSFNYFLNKHGRNSYNNRGWGINSYVHVGSYYNNAFWTGSELGFGDGSNNNPLVQLEVVGHELSHGVTEYEADLNYWDESGALNESFSDIFGKVIEFEEFGDTTGWIIAKSFRAGGLRNMSNPNLQVQPDTYKGYLWYTGPDDNGGVHYNSGVQNFWFYLLCVGGSGTNDHSKSYSVNSIGMETAAKIAYRNLSEYLTYGSDYVDARIGSMLSARDLYGKNSPAWQEVDKAWDAVGVTAEPVLLSLGFYDITATTVKINGTLQPRGDTVTYHYEYGTTPALGSISSTYNYIDKLEGTLTGLQPSTKYYVKLVAKNEYRATSFNSTFTTISLSPLVKLRRTVDVTETTVKLYGHINPNSLQTSFHFEYGLTPALGSVTPSVPIGNATEFLDVSASITGLQPRKTYYYKLVAANAFASVSTSLQTYFTATTPVVTSFSPAAAAIDTEVTITGQNFNPQSEKNYVSFGATRAAVLTATLTELKVKVPVGASLGPITVLDAESGLADESAQEFVPTFTGDFGKTSLQLRIGSSDYIYSTLVQDMDGDNKPDIVARHYLGFTVFQNVNQGGDITEESFAKNVFSSELTPLILRLVDFDGNGLKDVIVTYQSNITRIFPNQSVPGFVYFGAPVDLSIPVPLNDMVFADFDSDGHIDIGGTLYLPSNHTEFVVLRNLNPKGVIDGSDFEKKFSYEMSDLAYNLYTDDLNNDGRSDILAGVSRKDYVVILRNTSSPGEISFVENNVSNSTVEVNPFFVSQDLNQDGWKDITSYSEYMYSNLALIENKGTAPIISAEPAVVAFTDMTEGIIQPTDLDGDGKVDLLVGTDDGRFVMLKNHTEPDARLTNQSLKKFAEFGAEDSDVDSQGGMTINDLNGDGRPEVINTYQYNHFPHAGFQMEIWQNSVSDCIDPTQVTVDVSSDFATFRLPPNTSFDDFEFQYNVNSETRWWALSGSGMYLSQGYTYHIRVRARCYLGFTSYHYINFIPECVHTGSFMIGAVNVDHAYISASDLGLFEVQYSVAGKDQWVSVPQSMNILQNLQPGTKYEVRYRGRCSVPSSYKYKEFTTRCPDLSSLSVTDISFNRAVVSWSTSYAAKPVIEYSEDNSTWAEVDDQEISSLTPGKQYYVRGKLACTDIDSDYLTRTFITPCPEVSSITIDEITPFSARISWIDPANTNSYTVKYFPDANSNSQKIIETTSTFIDIDNLSAGTVYNVTVAPHCISTDIVTVKKFSTVCYAPFDLVVSDISYSTAELSWEDNFGGLPYQVEYSISGSNTWQSIKSTSTDLSLTKLRPATEYEVRVHIDCFSETAPFISQFFQTKAYEATTFGPNPTDDKITIYPSKDLIGNPFVLLDNAGRIMGQGVLQNYSVDLSGLSSGIYILKIEGEDPIKIFKHHKP